MTDATKYIKSENGYQYFEAVFNGRYLIEIRRRELNGDVYMKLTDDFAKSNGYDNIMEYLHYEEIINLEDIKCEGDIPEWLLISSTKEDRLSVFTYN